MDRRWTLGLRSIAVLLLITPLGTDSTARAASAALDHEALSIVQAYNSRNFGNPGWRRVHLDLKSGETVTRSFDVVNLWQRDGDVVRTLFVLERPATLVGTDYLLLEDPGDPFGMKVYLHLPAGRQRVLLLEPSSFGEGLLGSDFGYRDLRMRLPIRGYDLRALGRQKLLGRSVQVVEATPATPEAVRTAPWARARLYFLEEAPVLLGADYFAAAKDARPAKQMRVEGFRQIDGSWTETRIVMTAADNHSSVLTLSGFKAGVPGLAATLFQPENLPTVPGQLAAAGLAERDAKGGR